MGERGHPGSPGPPGEQGLPGAAGKEGGKVTNNLIYYYLVLITNNKSFHEGNIKPVCLVRVTQALRVLLESLVLLVSEVSWDREVFLVHQ